MSADPTPLSDRDFFDRLLSEQRVYFDLRFQTLQDLIVRQEHDREKDRAEDRAAVTELKTRVEALEGAAREQKGRDKTLLFIASSSGVIGIVVQKLFF